MPMYHPYHRTDRHQDTYPERTDLGPEPEPSFAVADAEIATAMVDEADLSELGSQGKRRE